VCETPLPWEEDYDGMLTVEEDSRLNGECEQLLGDSDVDDDPSDDRRSLQHFYRNLENGYGADNGKQAATPVARCGTAQEIPAISATQVQRKLHSRLKRRKQRHHRRRAETHLRQRRRSSRYPGFWQVRRQPLQMRRKEWPGKPLIKPCWLT
jgi:hypothetical protein